MRSSTISRKVVPGLTCSADRPYSSAKRSLAMTMRSSRVEHGQPLGHVLEGRIEGQVLRLQFFLAALQQLVLARQLCCKVFVLGDVLMGHDPAAVRARLNCGGNHAPIRQPVGEV